MYLEKKHPDHDKYISNEEFNNFNFPLHLHDHIEIAYVKDGSMQVRIENNVYKVNKGEFIVILPMNAHSYFTETTSKSQIVVMSNDFAEEFVDEYSNLTAKDPVIRTEYAKTFMKEFSKRHFDYFLCKSYVNYIAYLYKTSTTFTKKNEKLTEFIKTTINYIDNNYDKDPSIDKLSEELQYTTNYLSSLLNKTFNKTFMALVNEKRISKAIEYIINTDLNINEIAFKCGYKTIRSFNRNFHDLLGIAPSEYKK